MPSLRPWNEIKIIDSGEALEEIPAKFKKLDPHPYLALGAPYGKYLGPWFLRSNVLLRLGQAQIHLKQLNKNYKLAIFDAFRPVEVQAYMVNHVINQKCNEKKLDPADTTNSEYIQLVENVNNFWAAPSYDLTNPPPHSTGAAIDLTIADELGPIDMGSDIDEIGDVACPHYFQKYKNKLAEFHLRRMLLKDVMLRSGFVQHPNEWWHFSYGDQLWAWLTKSSYAIYGRCFAVPSNS